MTQQRALVRLACGTRRVARTALVAIGLTVAAAPLHAQVSTFDLSGVIKDQQGGVLPGASVTMRNEASGFTRTVVSDTSGRYYFASLPPQGTWKLTAELAGFTTYTRQRLEFNAGSKPIVNITLTVGQVQESVTVVQEAPLIDTAQATLSSAVSKDQIAQLPLNGRDYFDLALLGSGVTDVGTDGIAGKKSQVINGAYSRYTSYTLDGFNNTRDQHGVERTDIPIDAMSEFRVLTNQFSAEYGETVGGIVTVISKSGTNTVHGSGSLFARPGSWDSADLLTGKKAPFSRQDLAAVIGGPIIKDRTHYLGTYQYRNQDQKAVVTAPIDNGRFQGTFPVGDNRTRVFTKLDQTFDQNNHLQAKFALGRETTLAGVGGLNIADDTQTQVNNYLNLDATYTRLFSSNRLNEFRMGYSREDVVSTTEKPTFTPNGVALSYPGQGNLGSTNRRQTSPDRVFQIADTVTFHTVAHTVKIGGSTRSATPGGELLVALDGQYVFAPGAPYPYDPNNPASWPVQYVQGFFGVGTGALTVKKWHYAAFVQDDWRLRDTLTVNLGLRYQYETMVDDKVNLDPRFGFAWDATGDGKTVVRGGVGVFHGTVFSTINAFEGYTNPNGFRTVAFAPGDPNFPDYPNNLPGPNIPPGVVPPPGNFYLEVPIYAPSVRHEPESYNFTLGVDRQLRPTLSVAADFSYNRGRKLLVPTNVNAPSYFDYSTGARRSAQAGDAARPFGAPGRPILPGEVSYLPNGYPESNYRDLYMIESSGESRYKAVAFSINKQFSEDFSLQGQYHVEPRDQQRRRLPAQHASAQSQRSQGRIRPIGHRRPARLLVERRLPPAGRIPGVRHHPRPLGLHDQPAGRDRSQRRSIDERPSVRRRPRARTQQLSNVRLLRSGPRRQQEGQSRRRSTAGGAHRDLQPDESPESLERRLHLRPGREQPAAGVPAHQLGKSWPGIPTVDPLRVLAGTARVSSRGRSTRSGARLVARDVLTRAPPPARRSGMQVDRRQFLMQVGRGRRRGADAGQPDRSSAAAMSFRFKPFVIDTDDGAGYRGRWRIMSSRGDRGARMKRHGAAILAAIMLGSGHSLAATQAVGPHPRQAPPLVASHGDASLPLQAQNEIIDGICLGCHDADGKAGGLSLAEFDPAHAERSAAIAEKVIHKLRAGMMPPPAVKDRPGADTLNAFAASLEAVVDRAAAPRPNPGSRVFQRLTRAEYARAVRDLLDLDVDVDAFLPADTVSNGFDNIADVQTFSPVLTEGYLRAASTISSLAVGNRGMAPTEETYKVPRTQSQMEHVDGAPWGTRGGMSIVHTFPADGDYSFRIMLHSVPSGRLYASTARNEQIEVSINGERVSLLKIDYRMSEADKNGMNLVTPRVHVQAGPQRVSATFLERFTSPIDDVIAPIEYTLADTQIGEYGYGITTLPHLRDFSITGPFNVTGISDTPSRRRIFTCRPTSAVEELPCATKIVRRLASQAYREPPGAADVEPLLAFYQQGRTDGDFESGIRLALRAILVSPRFLFRVEARPAAARSGAAYRIGDLDLASRLSFFIWDDGPDEELLKVAAAGTLHQPDVLDAQARRLLADPRSAALSTRFAAQWLRLHDADGIRPDALLYPSYDYRLAQSFKRETELLFDSIVREDRSVLDLFTADYTFVNERLARHYGFPNVTGSAFRRVQLGREFDYRRGLLGQGSILLLTSVADRTSPVQRGKWILEVLLGSPPPPPPPNVPALDETKAVAGGGRTLSTRERMEEHRRNPACASCHKVIDPLGLTLEGFDVTGMRRIKDNGVPVDSAGVVYDGSTVRGPDGLRRWLLTRSTTVLRTFTGNLMAYALGRRVEYYDQPTIRAIVRSAESHQNRFSWYVLGIVNSAAFQMSSGQGASDTDQARGADGRGRRLER